LRIYLDLKRYYWINNAKKRAKDYLTEKISVNQGKGAWSLLSLAIIINALPP
jgi:hypothetical protein